MPLDDSSFDKVLCQFGVMFLPDKVLANSEARRVLRDGGDYLVVTFADLDANPVPKAADEAVDALFPDDPPRYMERGPSVTPTRPLLKQTSGQRVSPRSRSKPSPS